MFQQIGPFANRSHIHNAAGNDTEVQFNDGGFFGADSNLTFNKTSSLLNIHGKVGLTALASAPAAPADENVLNYVVTSGVSPNKTTTIMQKMANGDEIIVATIIS